MSAIFLITITGCIGFDPGKKFFFQNLFNFKQQKFNWENRINWVWKLLKKKKKIIFLNGRVLLKKLIFLNLKF